MANKQLGVLTVQVPTKSHEEITYYRKLSLHAKSLDLEIIVFHPLDVNSSGTTVKGWIYDSSQKKWKRKTCPMPPLVYDRCRYKGKENYAILKAFRSKHKHIQYMAKPLTNKLEMHRLLMEQPEIAPHLPATAGYSGPGQVLQYTGKYDMVYLKPKNSTGGRGILRIEKKGNHMYELQGRKQDRTILKVQRIGKKLLPKKLRQLQINENYIIQQGINLRLPGGRVHDYRLLLQKNKKGEWEVTGCAGRIGPTHSITSNLHGGGMAVPMEKLLLTRLQSLREINRIKHNMSRISTQVAIFLEGRFGTICELGIDLAVDERGKVWLLEVNPKPSREVFRKIGDMDTYRKAITNPLEFAIWLMEQPKASVHLFIPDEEAEPLSEDNDHEEEGIDYQEAEIKTMPDEEVSTEYQEAEVKALPDERETSGLQVARIKATPDGEDASELHEAEIKSIPDGEVLRDDETDNDLATVRKDEQKIASS